jgi:hypothetical protein
VLSFQLLNQIIQTKQILIKYNIYTYYESNFFINSFDRVKLFIVFLPLKLSLKATFSILAHFWSILGQKGAVLVHFWSLLALFAHFIGFIFSQNR